MATPTRNHKAAQAKDLLAHYFRLAAKGGWEYEGDNTAEIEDIIDLIIQAARLEMKAEIEQLEARINDLENYHN